ncbi:MAG: hypothetical protein OXC00_13235 [Acidimicrobiaceae bacterium]|nr:hypothetical protein [Acidimicrobiaceae bacterium]
MPRTTYNFILETSGRGVLDNDVFDALTEAGCDDAGIGRFLGVDRLDFDREAHSFCEAVRSAIEDVQSVPGVTVTRVVPGDDPTVGAAFTEAVNIVLASPVECPDMPASEEQTELRRIREYAATATRSQPRT